MTRFNPAKPKKISPKDARRDAEQLILLALKSEEYFKEALKVVAFKVGTPRGCITKIRIDKADAAIEGDKLARFTIFVQDEKVWEGWFERYLEKEQTKSNDNRVQEQTVTYATWKDEWYDFPEITPVVEKEDVVSLPGTVDEPEDLNKGI